MVTDPNWRQVQYRANRISREATSSVPALQIPVDQSNTKQQTKKQGSKLTLNVAQLKGMAPFRMVRSGLNL